VETPKVIHINTQGAANLEGMKRGIGRIIRVSPKNMEGLNADPIFLA
jgi:hypothetical protein